MSRLSMKFMLSLSAVLAAVTLISLYLNSNFIEHYYLYQEKKDMNRICDRLIRGADKLEQTIKELEQEEDVVIAAVKNSENNDLLNERLREAFLDKGLGLEKYWLWEQDRLHTKETGRRVRIYRQEKLHYSILVEYISLGEDFIASAKIIPSVGRTVDMINRMTAFVFMIAALIILLILYFLVRKITLPLVEIGKTAKAIAEQDFKKISITTHDELEVLAGDINDMSDKLREAREGMEDKNKQMETLLANVSHDLKTPVSLIKAYTSGMKDGVDDGTFLETVIRQNERMEHIISRLLNLAKIQQKNEEVKEVDISAVLNCLTAEYSIQAEVRNIRIINHIEEGLAVHTNREAAETILSNFLSNAVKYSDSPIVELFLYREEAVCVFRIENGVEAGREISIEHLWDPFYVAEESRNRTMAGTGLGLAIVRAAAQKYGITCNCTLDKGIICFTAEWDIADR